MPRVKTKSDDEVLAAAERVFLRRGAHRSTLADVAKEVAIYRAHKAMPIVIATRGATGFEGVPAVLEVPPCHPRLAFVLATMVGHLFGYEAAIAIDRLALPMREIRGEIERLAARAGPAQASPGGGAAPACVSTRCLPAVWKTTSKITLCRVTPPGRCLDAWPGHLTIRARLSFWQAMLQAT